MKVRDGRVVNEAGRGQALYASVGGARVGKLGWWSSQCDWEWFKAGTLCSNVWHGGFGEGRHASPGPAQLRSESKLLILSVSFTRNSIFAVTVMIVKLKSSFIHLIVRTSKCGNVK